MKNSQINSIGIFGIILWLIQDGDMARLIALFLMIIFAVLFNFGLLMGDD